MVSTTRGFLPRADPIVTLPPEFDPLESILQRMPVKTASGAPGLLAEGKLGDVVLSSLPDLTDHINKYASNLPLMNALYRDYSFLLSAYLLEPCHLRFMKGEPYGLARDVLPACIARPIKRCADLTGFQPFMEYAGSYALYNYTLTSPSLPLTSPNNLRLIRAFTHGLDPSSSEAGFVLVHILMVSHSPLLISSTLSSLSSAHSHLRSPFNTSLSGILTSLRQVNKSMETMWQRSKPTSYTSFRTFIFGITSQSMFPDGVLYEGIPEYDGKRQSFRGESGANDSMIPLMDNFLGVEMPDTPLTEILKDFRRYRPDNHREFIEWVKHRRDELGVKQWALGGGGGGGGGGGEDATVGDDDDDEDKKETKRLWLKLLDQVREFRWRHWCFAREYILKQTSHPTATGGSPIVTWLPNQLGAVLAEMERIYADDRDNLGEEIEGIMDLVKRQKEMLNKEVKKFCEERGVN
ncbi:indoleamine 2,3-dioxygenase-like protein [Apiosordaria backusii]|uniref:Indoleamine 2,3-dioxygenase-like protein n=1 Tax=Apiosordaria backusii TaxID=314023 RepID=A0AA40K4F2_9PEZI|nr:indoleamine 2,3-dioxygenase-like protein [Apiosordaria backusii]